MIFSKNERLGVILVGIWLMIKLKYCYLDFAHLDVVVVMEFVDLLIFWSVYI